MMEFLIALLKSVFGVLSIIVSLVLIVAVAVTCSVLGVGAAFAIIEHLLGLI